MSNIDHLKRHGRPHALSDLLGNPPRRARLQLSIRNGGGSDREVLGFTDLLNDYAALAFGNDMIRDMLRDNVDQYAGSMMDIAEGERDVCSVAFPFLSRGRMRA